MNASLTHSDNLLGVIGTFDHPGYTIEWTNDLIKGFSYLKGKCTGSR